jgi:Tfp pilus assembly protein PilX
MKREITRKKKSRESEKGAAMVMVLLVSFLLLVASAGLLLETSMNTMNVTDSTAEQQAYNAAESGVQSAINVLRGNVKPNPLFNADEDHKDNRINYTKAVRLGGSNAAGDSSTVARLSRWMDYNYAPNGINDTAVPARVTMGKYQTGYEPRSGYAYSLSVTDPDHTGEILSFNTTGSFFDETPSTRGWKDGSITFNGASSGDKVIISYSAGSAKNNLDVASGLITTNFGSFDVEVQGAGASITEDVRFDITFNMKAPYDASRGIRGWIRKAIVDSDSDSVVFDFDSPAFELMGSTGTLNFDPPGVNQLLISENSGETSIQGSITQAEPFRLVIRSIGYGPRGARKELEATIQKNFFNGLSAPATLTLVGKPGTNFSAGNSAVVKYFGSDLAEGSSVIIPPIGTTNQSNLDDVYNDLTKNGTRSIDDIKADLDAPPSDVSREMPFWLQSPDNLNKTILELRRVAKASGRLFQNGAEPADGDYGNNENATGITFVQGDLTISGDGGGILVCTGKLTFHGAFKFNGLIIVTGAEGFERTGGGNGLLQGNTVIAPYNPAHITPDNPNDAPAEFLTPNYRISGGGNSTIQFNSNSVANGMTAISNIVLGVAEK